MGNKQSPRPTAEEARNIFKEGNGRFVSGQLRRIRQPEASRKHLVRELGSIATILSCATSRRCNLAKDFTGKIFFKIVKFKKAISEMVQEGTVRAIEDF